MKNNQKSVRLSDYVCTLVEQSPGDTFSEKFGNLVVLAHETLPRIEADKKRLEQQCDLLMQKRGRLRKMIGDMESLHYKQNALMHSISDFCKAMDSFVQELK